MKTAVVLGAGGFIGSHLVRRLKGECYYVIGADLKHPEFSPTAADEFFITDLRFLENVERVIGYNVDEVYQLAADMGGAGYIFTGEHDADVMHNSAIINLHVAKRAVETKVKKLFYSSSACVYPEHNQMDPENPICSEESAYPANPDSEYGWEKLFSERMYSSFARNYGLDVRIARFHNIFGPCFDEETEVLTKEGWKYFQDINISNDEFATMNENNNLLYLKAVDFQRYYYSGKMYKIKGKSIDQLITPDHKIYCSQGKKGEYQLRRVKDLNWNYHLYKFSSLFNWQGEDFDDIILPNCYMVDGRLKYKQKKINITDWFEFIGWYVTEGCSFKTPSNYTVIISQYESKNSDYRDEIIQLLNRMGVHFSEDKYKKHIIISNKQIYEVIQQCGVGAKNKRIPSWMLSANKELLNILYLTMLKGDGCNFVNFGTVSTKLRDQFMEIALKLGKAVTYSINELPKSDKHNISYRVHISNRGEFYSKKWTRSIVDYNGMVYDVTLPKYHLLLIRRNGRVVWSGNCGSWNNGKEKAPAAICRKVSEVTDGGVVQIWGDGEQTRSFLYIDECLNGISRLMDLPNRIEPINIGSEEMVTINQLVDLVADIADKKIYIEHIDGPLGVRGRCSDNKLIQEKLHWSPSYPLRMGLIKTYHWINKQVHGR